MYLRSALSILATLALVSACNPRDGGTDSGPPTDTGPNQGRDAGADCTPTDENTAVSCTDGIDNDCNGFIDCNDFGCCGATSCTPDTTCGRRDAGPGCTPMGEENTEATCTDGIDNDCNGFMDCRDFSCGAFCPSESSNTACADGEDNDLDGFTDCDDRDCEMRIVCVGEVTNAACSDGIDNDGMDGVDCADPQCHGDGIVVCDGNTAVDVPVAERAALVATRCTNGVDDDGGSRFDCGEFSCLWNYPGCEVGLEQSNAGCSDGMDNDQDGFTDCEDSRCQQEGIVVCNGETAVVVDAADYGTLSNAVCSDDADNDDDAHSDCDDFSCSQNPDVDIATCPGERDNETCSDGLDNDNNTPAGAPGLRADCADFGCSQNPFITVCETSFAACSNGQDDDGNRFADCNDFSCTPLSNPNPACM